SSGRIRTLCSFPTRRSSDLVRRELAVDGVEQTVLGELGVEGEGVQARLQAVVDRERKRLADVEIELRRAARRQVIKKPTLIVDEDRKSTRLNSSHVKISYAV